MAYAAVLTYSPTLAASQAILQIPVGGLVVVNIAETDCASTSEATITLHNEGMVLEMLSQKCSLTSGTGATVDPILGTATAPSGVNIVAENDTPAATVINAPSSGAPFYSSSGTLYHRSRPNAGTDNVIATQYIFRRIR